MELLLEDQCVVFPLNRAKHVFFIHSRLSSFFGTGYSRLSTKRNNSDLHHRLGWRKSYNYGKQTRIWDTIFGTKRDRMEVLRENIDWKKT